MAWTLSLTHFFCGQGREKDKDMMEELAVSIHENYFTFKGWADGGSQADPSGTLVERLSKNFAAFRRWNG